MAFCGETLQSTRLLMLPVGRPFQANCATSPKIGDNFELKEARAGTAVLRVIARALPETGGTDASVGRRLAVCIRSLCGRTALTVLCARTERSRLASRPI